MKIVDLTTEQLQVFFDAVGSSKTGVAGGRFNTRKLQRVAESTGGFNDWPKHTDDPWVNHVIDCITARFCGDKDPEYDEKLYLEEIEAFKELDEKERLKEFHVKQGSDPA